MRVNTETPSPHVAERREGYKSVATLGVGCRRLHTFFIKGMSMMVVYARTMLEATNFILPVQIMMHEAVNQPKCVSLVIDPDMRRQDTHSYLTLKETLSFKTEMWWLETIRAVKFLWYLVLLRCENPFGCQPSPTLR